MLCSASGTTEDDLQISTQWTSVGECGQYSLSWTGTALWDSTQTVTGSDTPSTEGSYTISDVMPYSQYNITLMSAGENYDSCTATTPETGKNNVY